MADRGTTIDVRLPEKGGNVILEDVPEAIG